jgi:oxygen-independent coproporphyrinogen-3 oxidase
MAGIYIHIPFCRQKCYYCDFYKTVNTSLSKRFLSVLKEETKVRKNYILNETVDTIYFGGGTPSVLTVSELADLLRFFKNEFTVNSNAEITFEANPDDLSVDYLKGIKDAGVNRLSIGIQSFQNKHLEKMNRRHNSVQAVRAIEDAEKIGFDNLSVDLIYGLPGLTETEWIESLNTVFCLPVQHLSAYHLTYHEGTPFYTWLKKGTLKELKETESVRQFNILLDLAGKNNYEQYEISNFAKNEMYSKHNTSYWMGKKYLGLGPSAHSFDGVSRRWNVSNVESYLKAFEKDTDYFEEEILSQKDKFNEYVLTRIRTKWGVSLEFINQSFGGEMKNYLLKQIEKYRLQETIILENGIVTLSKEGLFISDEIMVDLMII